MAAQRHPKAAQYLRCGLFDGLQRFSELEQRLRALASEKERGDAFEVFVQAYLSLLYPLRVAAVHTLPLPVALADRLSISPTADRGIDGVFELPDGELIPYQVKFRSDRASTPDWTELSTFFGLADSVKRRLVISNATALNRTAAARRGAFFIRGNEFDALGSEDFGRIRDWLSEQSVSLTPVASPREHQSEALERIHAGFLSRNRLTALLAFAAGKTLLGMWAAEQEKPSSVVVFSPSLSLLSQTVKTWLTQGDFSDWNILIVCSDGTAADGARLNEQDEADISPTDVAFPITTNVGEIREHLVNGAQSKKLVFCTYHSADVLAQALPCGFTFDFGVFDEAHRTAGTQGTQFTFALFNENLPILKRLFLSATPRVCRSEKTSGSTPKICSMDDESLYGPVVYRLSLREAIRRKIISDYRILVSVVNREMLPPGALKAGTVVSENGSDYDLRLAGAHAALGQAMAEYDIKKAFTFHSRVRNAALFSTHPLREAYRSQGKDMWFGHVSGAMSIEARNATLESFATTTSPAVLSNARVLLEGTNVPAVDLVALMDAKSSPIDVSQALGRALRLHPDKNMAFIFLPREPRPTAALIEKARLRMSSGPPAASYSEAQRDEAPAEWQASPGT